MPLIKWFKVALVEESVPQSRRWDSLLPAKVLEDDIPALRPEDEIIFDEANTILVPAENLVAVDTGQEADLIEVQLGRTVLADFAVCVREQPDTPLGDKESGADEADGNVTDVVVAKLTEGVEVVKELDVLWASEGMEAPYLEGRLTMALHMLRLEALFKDSVQPCSHHMVT